MTQESLFPGHDLTTQQIQMLKYLEEGMQNKEIAYRMGKSIGVIKTSFYPVFRKIGVQNRTQAAMWSFKNL